MSDGLSQEFVKNVFDYRDGGLYWKVKFSDKVNVGAKAGCIKSGRRYIRIQGKSFLNYRLIYLWHHGYVPKIIDHIDGNPLNDLIDNLRESSQSQNQYNTKKPKTNTSGHKNVCWKKDRQKWKVEICVEKSKKFFGYYDDFELACLVADEARLKHHKEFANHG